MRYPIYEALPYIYMAAGGATVIGVDDMIAKICGGLLFSAGWVIRSMRRSYRKKSLVDPVTISSRW